MAYLLFGLAALLAFLLLTRAYTVANPQALVRGLRISAGVVVLAGAGVLVARGAVGYAAWLAGIGAWLLWGMGTNPFGGSAQKSPGQTSRVTTEHLDVELDHDTGAISGRVLRGAFTGRDLESLTPAEMAQLWQDCRFADPQSAQIIETYLDRVHPTWREDMTRAQGTAGESDSHMTRAQALDVLGLTEDASDEDIRRAHRDLMLKMHPDRGGSTFLAAKINQAKDVLLGR